MKYQFEGLDEFNRDMKKLYKEVKPKIEKVVRHHAGACQEKAIRYAPYRTGNLKKSIQVKIETGGTITGTVQPYAHYAAYVELGTRFMGAQPYLRPAFDSQVKAYKKDLEDLLK